MSMARWGDISMVETTFMPITNTSSTIDVVARLNAVSKQFDAMTRELEECVRGGFGVRRHVNVPFVELTALIEQARGMGECVAAIGDTIAALRALNAAQPINPFYSLSANLTSDPSPRGEDGEDPGDWLNDQPQDSLNRAGSSSSNTGPSATLSRTKHTTHPVDPVDQDGVDQDGDGGATTHPSSSSSSTSSTSSTSSSQHGVERR